MAIIQGVNDSGIGESISRVKDGDGTSLAIAEKDVRELLEGIALSLRQMVYGLSLLTRTNLAGADPDREDMNDV